MMQELISNISAEWECKDLRVIVLAAEGKIFSSGHDLKELVSICPGYLPEPEPKPG